VKDPISTVISPEERKALWLQDRLTAITGTDVASILGLSKFSSPTKVWQDKLGISAPFVDSEPMKWGRRLERPILDAYFEELGEVLEFADPYTLHRVPGFPLLGASLDARRKHNDRRPVDAKCLRARGSEYGEPGTDAFPIYYQTQLAVQMMATGTEVADLAVLFSGQEFAVYTLHRDLEVEGIIKEKVASWWQRHIVEGVEPDPDGSDSCTEYLRGKFARAGERTVEATVDVLDWVRRHQAADAAEKAAKAEKAEAGNLIRAYLGDASAIPGVLTYRNNKDSAVIDYEGAFQMVASSLDPSSRQTVIDSFTSLKPGPRVMRFAK